MAAPSTPSSPTVRAVAHGVFFKLPERLPRGRHGLSPEQVSDAQRERILAAVTELLAAHGYRDFGAIDIARRARVSLEAFYACYGNKDDCVFAGYDRFIKVLLGRLTSMQLVGVSTPTLAARIVGVYLDTLQSDLVVARAYQVEIDALGFRARECRRKSLHLFADFVRQAVKLASPGRKPPRELTWSAYLGVVYAVRQLASDALDSEKAPNLSSLRADVEVWLSDLFRER